MFFSHKNRYYFVLLLAVYTYINTVICQIYIYFNLPVLWYEAFIIIFLITLFCWESNRLIHPFINKWFPSSPNITKHAIAFFIAGFFASALLTVATDLVFGMIIKHHSTGEMVNPLKMTLTYVILVNLLFHLVNTIFLYEEAYRKKTTESEMLKRMHAQAELMAVKQQINPHFLFNNLNVLSGLVMQQSSEANNFIEAFSRVYMHILNTHNQELISLHEELNYLQPYAYLLQQRFPDSLQIKTEIPDKYRHRYIIPVALQMLVENAIKHNVLSSKKPLCIRIYINREERLTVENTLQARPLNNSSSKSGLKNIQKRYELVTGENIAIEKNEKVFSITLPLIEINTYESINS